MSILPKIRAKYGEGIGVELFFAFPDLQDDEKTYIDSDSAAGAVSFAANGTNFAVGQFIVIGQPGNERTEILQIHASTTPTGTTITLASAAAFAHNRGDIIRFIPYNQIAAYFSTDGVNYTAITAVAIRPDSTETYMQRASDLSTYYYKFQFYNSSTTNVSAFSAIATASGYADNTIWSVKRRALRQLGEEISDLISDQDLNDWVQEGRRLVDYNPAVFRWSFRQKFGVVVAQMKSGEWKFTAPTDLRDRNSPKNIMSIRIGNQNMPMMFQPRVRFNQNYLNVSHSTAASAAIFGATTLVLASTHDFDASGVATISGQSVGGLRFNISYTGNNKTTNTISGVTGIPAGGIASGSEVWQRAVFGLPRAYTIDSAVIYVDTPLNDATDGMDAKMDYYTTIPAISTDDQTFDEPFYDLYVYFLKWKIKSKKANGKISRDSDSDWKDWVSGVTDLISQEFPGATISFVPDIEGFLSATE